MVACLFYGQLYRLSSVVITREKPVSGPRALIIFVKLRFLNQLKKGKQTNSSGKKEEKNINQTTKFSRYQDNAISCWQPFYPVSVFLLPYCTQVET